MRRVRVTMVTMEKQKYNILCVCVCVFVFVCSLSYPSCKARPRIIFSSVAIWLFSIFFTLSHKRHDFRKKLTEHKMCVSIFSITFVWNISHSKKNWARYDQKYIHIGLHLKYPIFLSYFNETLIFSPEFLKVLRYHF